MVLSNQEIYTAYIEAANQTLRPQDERIALAFARAIEAALLSKLAQGVSVEPDYQRLVYKVVAGDNEQDPDDYRDYYTLETLNTAIAAARVAALEEAAIAADLFCNGGESQRPLKYPVADAIRALIEKEST
jgi:hypothetical protein